MDLNELVRETFQMNSFADNIAYGLDVDFNCVKATKIYHEKYAHIFPNLADDLYDIMSKENIRTVRLGLEDEIKQYNDLYEMFFDNFQHIKNYRDNILQLIKILEEKNEISLKLDLENYFQKTTILLKQCKIWCDKSKEIEDIATFDKYFDSFLII